jgi:hypothetical protein
MSGGASFGWDTCVATPTNISFCVIDAKRDATKVNINTGARTMANICLLLREIVQIKITGDSSTAKKMVAAIDRTNGKA